METLWIANEVAQTPGMKDEVDKSVSAEQGHGAALPSKFMGHRHKNAEAAGIDERRTLQVYHDVAAWTGCRRHP